MPNNFSGYIAGYVFFAAFNLLKKLVVTSPKAFEKQLDQINTKRIIIEAGKEGTFEESP